MIRSILIFIVLGMIAACNKDDDETTIIKLKKEFSLKVEESAVYSSSHSEFEMLLTGITDTRCPKNVVCVTDGGLKVDLDIKAEQVKSYQICLGLCVPEFEDADAIEFQIGSETFRLQLVDVSPYPLDVNEQTEKTARFVLTKN